jgi:3-oxoacyl-[acyl-carrier protein] reductase
MDKRPFQDQVVIITGVSRGIGRACALQFSQDGAQVVGIYRANDRAAQEVSRQIQTLGGQLRLYKGSVSDRMFVRKTIEEVYCAFGRVDVLINNAGITRDELALFMTEEQWNEVLAANFLGTAFCLEAVLPYMQRQGRGNIVNVLSVSALYGREAQANYAASKGMILGLTKLLARKYQAHGITICALAPGLIDTEMAASLSSQKTETFLKHTLAGRLGTPEEMAQAISYLAGPQAQYFSGQVLKMDGGFLR